MKIKGTMIEVKAKVVAAGKLAMDFVDEHKNEIFCGITTLLLGGAIVYLNGYSSGIREGQKEWDFSNDEGEWAILMDDEGEFRTALPMTAVKEIMENHRCIDWDNSKWKR